MWHKCVNHQRRGYSFLAENIGYPTTSQHKFRLSTFCDIEKERERTYWTRPPSVDGTVLLGVSRVILRMHLFFGSWLLVVVVPSVHSFGWPFTWDSCISSRVSWSRFRLLNWRWLTLYNSDLRVSSTMVWEPGIFSTLLFTSFNKIRSKIPLNNVLLFIIYVTITTTTTIIDGWFFVVYYYVHCLNRYQIPFSFVIWFQVVIIISIFSILRIEFMY